MTDLIRMLAKQYIDCYKREHTGGNICLSIKCRLRFWGVEHLRSQPSIKHPYYRHSQYIAYIVYKLLKHTVRSPLSLLPPTKGS